MAAISGRKHRIEFSPKAARQFKKLPRDLQVRLGPKIDSLAENPRPVGSKKLKGSDAIYRLRVGDHRILYQIQDKVLLVLVLAIGPRAEIYR
jgi:mRNA interferase RelE/StbE